MNLTVKKDFSFLKGEITVPADKSISHRAVILASIAKGRSVIKNFSQAADPQSTFEVCKNLGVNIEKSDTNVIIDSNGVFKQSAKPLYCGNSGTTMRLISGVLAAQDFKSELIGDESLSNRPMKRIITPLELMGAEIKSENFKAPLTIFPAKLHGITYKSEISSAQVKSCILLAGLNAQGHTVYSEPCLSRNHTEIMLKSMGADILINDKTVSINKSELHPLNIEICGDISSAAYFITAALIVPNSDVILKNTGLNPTRTGILDVLQNMNADIEILDKREICGETVGDIRIKYSPNLKSCEIHGDIIPRLIDELPVIALLATQAYGKTVIKDAQELRAKESDRIKSTVEELQKLGADIHQTPDGMVINGKSTLKGGAETDCRNDHRLAMTLYTAGLITQNEIRIKNFEWVNISFPNFVQLFEGFKCS